MNENSAEISGRSAPTWEILLRKTSSSFEFVRQRSAEFIFGKTNEVLNVTSKLFFRMSSHFYISDLEKTAVKGKDGFYLFYSSRCMLCKVQQIDGKQHINPQCVNNLNRPIVSSVSSQKKTKRKKLGKKKQRRQAYASLKPDTHIENKKNSTGIFSFVTRAAQNLYRRF